MAEPDSVEYHPFCAVAFLDVLGWREMVQQSLRDDDLRNKMAIALSDAGLQRVHFGNPEQQFPIDIGVPVITQFSDSIVISANFAGNFEYHLSLHSFLNWLDWICKPMLQNGLFMRGGLACGPLYHRENIVFGPALNAAYYLESQYAKHPRVIYSNSPPYPFPVPDNYHDNPFFKDKDGYFVLDVLRLRPESVAADGDQAAFLNEIRPILVRNLEQQTRNWRVLEKYLWFARYFNQIAKEFQVELITLPLYHSLKRDHIANELRLAEKRAMELRAELSVLDRLGAVSGPRNP